MTMPPGVAQFSTANCELSHPATSSYGQYASLKSTRCKDFVHVAQAQLWKGHRSIGFGIADPI
jgi:hypothetical protein